MELYDQPALVHGMQFSTLHLDTVDCNGLVVKK